MATVRFVLNGLIRMNKRLALKLIVLVMVVVGLAFVYERMFVHRISRDELSAEIAADLPKGTSKAKVIKWLESRTDVSFYDSSGISDVSNPSPEPIEKVWAQVQDTGPRWDDPYRLILKFYFSGDRFSRVEIEERPTPIVL